MDERDHLQRRHEAYSQLHPYEITDPRAHVVLLLEAHTLVRQVIEHRPRDARSIQLETIADGLDALARSLEHEVR